MFKNYYEVRDWLENFIPFTYSKKNLGLARISYLLKLLGNPQKKFKSILVAGTSGKGSTVFYIAELLEFSLNWPNHVILGSETTPESILFADSGQSQNDKKKFKIGLHLSPHLAYIGERMQIFRSRKSEVGSQIPVGRLIDLMNEVRLAVEAMRGSKVGSPSYFEILVAASFLYFARQKVDWAVVEVGLGGRLDATNVLQPEISVITNVGLDHTDILGKTIEEIAFEKAGIIKASKATKLKARPFALLTSGYKGRPWSGRPVVTGAGGKALKVIENVAKQKNAPLIKIDTRLEVEPLKSVFKDYPLIYKDIERYIDKSLASANFLLALVTVLALGFRPSKKAVKKVVGLGLEGRFERVDDRVILDGAHNADKIGYLINILRANVSESRNKKETSRPFDKAQGRQARTINGVVLVVAFKKGKDWKKMLDLLVKNLPIKKIIATKFQAVTDTGRFAAVEPNEIAKYVNSKWKMVNGKSFDNSQEAVYEAINLTSKKLTANRLVLVTGSLYLVGEVRTIWHLPSFA